MRKNSAFIRDKLRENKIQKKALDEKIVGFIREK